MTDSAEEITEQEVRDLLFSMSKKKAPGFDDIMVKILCKARMTIKGRMEDLMKEICK